MKKTRYMIRGIVRHGDKRGRTLGFPTANVQLHQRIPSGIYISETRVGTTWLPSMTYIGEAETFGIHPIRLESHILDFNKNIYDQWISVRLLKFLHGSKKFDSVDALIVSMKKDEQSTREFFA